MEKNLKIISIAIWIAIITSTMSFFGFVYEEIDFIPNFFNSHPIESKLNWNSFHSITNPSHYHILPAICCIFSLTIIWFNKHHIALQQISKLKVASILVIIVNILTGIAVTYINDKLYFNKTVESTTLKNLAIAWATLNFVRITLTAIYTVILMKMFSIKLIINQNSIA
jgi:hypothetical protein